MKLWKNTYLLDYSTNGIFEADCKPFDIGQKKYSVADLKEIDSVSMQKKYNEFASILRKYNVSSKENAFDKLINLFLAKIVDETNNQSELKCLWKGAAYDNYFDMQDRLLSLYKIGMKKFFGDDIAYVENEEIETAFKFLKNASEEDVAKQTILGYFRILKYFNNNPFAFLDVHNEELFYQNAVILKEIVNMVQDIKIKTEEQNQFLGDLFEGFLDQGIKQSEGQFFTPLPIVKFLVSSLPLDSIIKNSKDLPKVIDYACGAGHFLTEYANQIKPIVKKYNKAKLENYYENIFGIEKEYRLSKVSQVSAFMYGQDGIKILYKDALAKTDEVQEGTYSVLVANPPYSVKGFLETLSEDDRERFELFNNDINIDTNNSIETFFVERAAQLLQKDGVAAIILPSSVLSNGNIYIKCREIILKYFDLVAIFESGSGTFGKTGTNTATLFMRRREDTPALHEQYANRVNSWFSGNFDYDRVYEDADLMQKYCAHQNYDLAAYKKFCSGNLTDELLQNGIFADYKKTFENDTTAKNIRKKKITPKYTEENKKAELEQYIFFRMKETEKDKLYFFMLSSVNQNVLVIKSPADNKEIKKFLGYEWSASKGNEGIKYLGFAAGDDDEENQIAKNKGIEGIQTPLFNPQNFDDETKLNTLVRKNFLQELSEKDILQELNPYAKLVPLCEMLDFSRTSFDKAIKTAAVGGVGTRDEGIGNSKFPLVKLGDYICENDKSKIQVNQAKENQTGEYPFYTSGLNIYRFDNFLVDGENIYLATGGNAIVQYYKGKASYSTDTWSIKSNNQKEAMTCYLYLLLNERVQEINTYYFKGTGLKHLQKNDLKQIQIPLPPLDVQKSIIAECEKVDADFANAQKQIEDAKQQIAEIMGKEQGNKKKLKEICNMKAGKFVSAKDIFEEQQEDMYPCFGGNGLRGYTKDYTHDGVYPLIGRQGALCGNVCLATGKFHATEHAVAVTPNSDIDVYWFRYKLEYMNLNQYATGTAQPGLSVNKILEVTCSVPSLTEQQKIVSKVQALEQNITTAKNVLSTCPARKAEILRKHLM